MTPRRTTILFASLPVVLGLLIAALIVHQRKESEMCRVLLASGETLSEALPDRLDAPLDSPGPLIDLIDSFDFEGLRHLRGIDVDVVAELESITTDVRSDLQRWKTGDSLLDLLDGEQIVELATGIAALAEPCIDIGSDDVPLVDRVDPAVSGEVVPE